MTRWAQGQWHETPKIDAFLAELHEVCKKHHLSLEPGDVHSGMTVIRYDDVSDFEIIDNAAAGVSAWRHEP